MGVGVIYYIIQGREVFEPIYIDLQDIDSEWLSFTSLRVTIEVLNKNDFDCEVDIWFEVLQAGEATQVMTKTFILSAHFKHELHADFDGLDSSKQGNTRASIINQKRAVT